MRRLIANDYTPRFDEADTCGASSFCCHDCSPARPVRRPSAVASRGFNDKTRLSSRFHGCQAMPLELQSLQAMERRNSKALEWRVWRDLAGLAAEALAIGVVFSVLLALAVFIVARADDSSEASLRADAASRVESRA